MFVYFPTGKNSQSTQLPKVFPQFCSAKTKAPHPPTGAVVPALGNHVLEFADFVSEYCSPLTYGRPWIPWIEHDLFWHSWVGSVSHHTKHNTVIYMHTYVYIHKHIHISIYIHVTYAYSFIHCLSLHFLLLGQSILQSRVRHTYIHKHIHVYELRIITHILIMYVYVYKYTYNNQRKFRGRNFRVTDF